MNIILAISLFICYTVKASNGVETATTSDASQLCTSNATAQKGICDCENRSSPPWGIRALYITCQYRDFNINNFDWEVLPPLTEYLDLSWNNFGFVPSLTSSTLKRFTVSHNNITALDDDNFAQIPNLTELDVSWNSIEVVSVDAFHELTKLRVLDMSHNNIKRVSFHVFSYFQSLQSLNMAWNENFGETFTKTDSVDIFLDLGVTPKLKTLNLAHCGLSQIDISHGTSLENLYLDGNNFVKMPETPLGIKFIDVSGNLFETLGPKFMPDRLKLEVIIMEDMPKLKEIQENALYGLPSLKKLSFQNSRSLERFDGYAFGPEKPTNETDVALEEVNLRGSSLKTLNFTLWTIFQNLKVLNLDGIPFSCDCRSVWIKHLPIETNAQCFIPKGLRGDKISEMHFTEHECKSWPGWFQHTLQGLAIILLLILCTVGFYMLVVRLRPSHSKTIRKIGPASPYAPITIEPNRAENHF